MSYNPYAFPKTLVRSLALCLLLTLTAGIALAETSLNETRTLNPGGTLEISLVSGSLEVIGGAGQVEISGTLGDDVEELEITGGGDRLEIHVKTPRHSTRDMDISAHLTLHVPGDATLEAQSVSAPVTVEALDERVEVRTVSGEIRIDARPRVVDLQTVSGEIHTRGARERTEVQSVSSRIELGDIQGHFEASTVSGGILVSGGSFEEAGLNSVSGDIEITTDLLANARLDVNSHSGNVVLNLSSGVSARFEVSTFSGEVDNQLGPPAESTGKYTPGKSLEFSVGGGSARVNVSSFSGKVTIQ